ncbi:MAG: sorbosone dehydrogenase family protein [Kofleriaceae bacterium]
MRHVLGVLLALAACSNNKKQPGDGSVGDAVPGDVAADAQNCEALQPLPACAAPVSGSTMSAREIGRVTGAALLATSPPDDPRLFVLERSGRIRIFENEMLVATPFIDLSESLAAGDERGLLGLAFHPNYHCNRQFFVFYTTTNANVLARCTVSAGNPNIADPTCTTVLSIPDFAANHNGGMIEFGADGYLYIGTGDGGDFGDPHRNGQSINDGSPRADSVALLGKILRIDVDNRAQGKEYGIPADNPFANGGGRPEIFVIGLRNPWRWSFDRGTGDMWIGDVGQGELEELNVLKAGEQAGKNLGWSKFEGDSCCETQADKCTEFPPYQGCDTTGLTAPNHTRTDNAGWLAIIGGQVYRGTCYPDIVGWHFYSDYNAGGLYKARLMQDGQLEIEDLTVPGFPTKLSSIHADARGELYITTTTGYVYHLEAGP